MNAVLRYLDLYRDYRVDGAVSQGAGEEEPNLNLWLVLHYVAFWLGIVAKMFLESLEPEPQSSVLSWPTRLLVSIITSLFLFAGVYRSTIVPLDQPKTKSKKATAARREPPAIQLLATFTLGVGYRALLEATNL